MTFKKECLLKKRILTLFVMLMMFVSGSALADIKELKQGSKEWQQFVTLMDVNLKGWSFHKDDERFDEAADDYAKRPDAVFWDTAPMLFGNKYAYRGWAEYQRAAEGWSKKIDQADISVTDEDQFRAWRYNDVVWHTMHCKIALILPNGDKPAPKCRGTVVWEWEGDRWRIAHETFSLTVAPGEKVFQANFDEDSRVEQHALFSKLAGEMAAAWGSGSTEGLIKRLKPFYLKNKHLTVYTPWENFEVYQGWKAYKRGLKKNVIKPFKRVSIRLDDNLEAHQRGKLVWSHATAQVETELRDGVVVSGTVRQTLVWFLTDDGWRVLHEHFSYPK